MTDHIARMTRDPDDPKALIRESYNIEGITAAECRSILVDWALSLPLDADQPAAAKRLHAARAQIAHPMTALLAEAAAVRSGDAKRRGGRAGKFATMAGDTAEETSNPASTPDTGP
ncbi:hypothetical protein [Pararhodobacter oceanensis]|uniref:hypothetical protein n=1 Tax=Pararhodobacter oceanensis TaxID=2172121 RepID=UPI003A946048